ncbi:MAG: HEAT repeat domain-containing protein [Elusimicrobiota bacterium]|nr:HEAT repeat domain-containing protein [Elusimicrobiota bacterium]
MAILIIIPALPGQAQSFSKKELGRKALQTVVDQLKSDDSDVRAQAAEILGGAGNKAAAGMLKNMLGDRDKYVRIAASRALWELGSPAGMKVVLGIINDAPAQGPIAVTNTPLVELKIISQNKIRAKAIEAYAWLKGEKGADLLYKLKNDNYGPIRDAAARELARLGHDEELAQFTEALGAEDEAIRYESASVLSKICHSSAAEPLAKLLAAEKSVRVRMAALDALKCTPSKIEAAAVLIKLTDDTNPTIKYKAVSALGGIKDAKVKEKLAALSSGAADIRIKIAAQKGLMLSGAPADVKTALDAMSAATPEIRLDAIDVAAAFSDADALPLLAQALDDPDMNVKLAGALQTLRRASKKE